MATSSFVLATLLCFFASPSLTLRLLPLPSAASPLRAPPGRDHLCVGPASSQPHGRLACRPRLAASDEAPSKGPLVLSPEVTIGIGLALLLVLVGNRLFTDELLNSQSRADLIATIAPTVLVLEGLTRIDITPREAEAVPLVGQETAWVAPGLAPELRQQLEWSADALMSNLPARSLAVWHDGATLALRGTLPASAVGGDEACGRAVVPGPLLTKCSNSKSGAPDYLPSLPVLPGRVEFSYLPAATQALLLVPLPKGALILGADAQRAFKDDDVAWARAVAAALASRLEA